jgi:hypothetical protein
MRTQENYEENREKILSNLSLRGKYGIIRDHPFTDLPYFDITKCSPPDLMHDINEGVILKTLKLILRKILTSKERIEKFNKDMKVLNWPCGQIRDIKKDNVEVSGTASQMFLFESLPQLLHQTFSSQTNVEIV